MRSKRSRAWHNRVPPRRADESYADLRARIIEKLGSMRV